MHTAGSSRRLAGKPRSSVKADRNPVRKTRGCSAQAIVAFSHPGRCRNDAAFASLAGTCPIPASSGRTVRHRLNRGGDRALNRAIHTIATVRMRDCPTTQAYIARRTAGGKTIREIKRCLKRYIARQLYRTLTATMTPTTNNPAVA